MNSASPQSGRDNPVLAFDLGGTWFRVALVRGNEVISLGRTPALSRRNHSATPAELQQLLVNFIVNETRAAGSRYPLSAVGISLGAAVNARTGLVVGSAPLWGPDAPILDLRQALTTALSEVRWSVVNDVTALAYALLQAVPKRLSKKAAALTVSTGIAYRSIDLHTLHIPFDAQHGLQGEIGHLPVEVSFRGRPLSATCDCGEPNHLSAFASGRAIERLLASLPEASFIRDGAEAHGGLLEAFGVAVKREVGPALELLDLFTRPLAKVLVYQSTLDPEVSPTLLYGGVVESLGGKYVESLLRGMHEMGLYQITSVDRSYFSSRIRRGDTDGLSALRGAAVVASGTLEERRSS